MFVCSNDESIAHQVRMQPSAVFLKEQIGAGLIGELLEVHAMGSCDNRAGGEEMMILGCHVFDMVRFLLGGKEAEWCTARILQQGHEVTMDDVRNGTQGEEIHPEQPLTEAIGPLVGDEINAQFSFEGGVHVSYTSKCNSPAQ